MSVTAACSVVIPTYNRAAYLRDALDSVQAQTFPDWELLVVDDRSTDDTARLVTEIARLDPRVRLLRNSGAKGPGAARNTGLRDARGRYVAFLDSDDRWEPSKLSHFMAAAHAHPEAVLIGSDYTIRDVATNTIRTMRDIVFQTMLPWWEEYEFTADLIPCARLRENASLLADREIALSMTIAGFLWIHTSSAMLDRHAALEAGAFDERLLLHEDTDLWLRMIARGSMVFIDRELAIYDVTGRADATGERYAGHDPARLHTKYMLWAADLMLLERIGRTHVLSPAQCALLSDRLNFFQGECASAAWRAGMKRRWLGHALAASRQPLARYAGRAIQRWYSSIRP